MLSPRLSSVVLLFGICGKFARSITLPFQPVPAGALAIEGLSEEPKPLLAALPNGGAASTTGWNITADSQEAGFPPQNALDGNQTTYFHSQYKPTLISLPHTITIDTLSVNYINGITYLPRQDGSKNGNIGQHKIYVSTDGINFGNSVAFGTWYDDQTLKSSAWETVPARYVRIVAITEAGNRGSWTSAAEISVYTVPTFQTPILGAGSWGPTVDFPLVPVAAAVNPDSGNVVAWSSWNYKTQYNRPSTVGSQTFTSLFNPATGIVTPRTVSNTQHDMFCPGLSLGATGHVIVTGGNSAPKTSIFVAGTNVWSSGANMQIPRGYAAQATMGDGRVFTIGGSWNGGQGGKNGEIYDPKANIWTKLAGCPVTPMYTADVGGVFRRDNHGWLFNWKGSRVFQAGPSKQMNWYNTNGTGATTPAGLRGNDQDSMCGDAVMYDAANGKILTVGGSPNYQGSEASNYAHIITLGAPDTPPTVQNINSMEYARIFGSSVVLPDGTVFITGGQTYGLPYSDGNSSLTSEIFNPATMTFTPTIAVGTPRNYHSWALLMQDATVLVGGGGLCNTCSTNHFDAQIFTPQYLLNADGSRNTNLPVIQSISSRQNKPGATITVVTAAAVPNFSLMRYGSATHTVNTDQRRVAIVPTVAGTNTYNITLGPADYGVVTPGYWMLFALNAAGVPSVSTTILII